MTKAQHIARLRRLLNLGTTTRPFTDAVLEDFLNDAWRDLKTLINKIRPEEFIETWRTNIVANQGDYARVSESERALRILDTTSLKYVPVEPVDSIVIQKWDAQSAISTLAPFRYSRQGQFYRIRPLPSTNITDGLEVETLGIDTAMDTTGPNCPNSIQNLITYRAAILAYDESQESGGAGQGRAEAEWSKAMDRIFGCYVELQGESVVPQGIR